MFDFLVKFVALVLTTAFVLLIGLTGGCRMVSAGLRWAWPMPGKAVDSLWNTAKEGWSRR